MKKDEVLDVDFQAPAVQEGRSLSSITGGAMRFPTAEEMLGAAREYERFKAGMLSPKDYHPIDGRMVPKASAAMRLSVAPQISFEIISKNEHGEPGVRRSIIQELRYPLVKKMTKKRRKVWSEEKREKVYKVFDEEELVFDFDAEPRLVPRVLYTVTIRGRDAWGRTMDHEASFDGHELGYEASDNTLRARCETRARSAVAVKLIGGVDAEIAEEVLREMKVAAAAKAEQLRNAPKIPSAAELLDRAKAIGLCGDGPGFIDWAKNNVIGCENLESGKIIPKEVRPAIIDALDLAEERS